MRKYLLSLIVVLILILAVVTLYGCEGLRLPDWLKFGQGSSRAKIERAAAELKEKVEGTTLASINGQVITLEDFNQRIEAYNAEIQASTEVSAEIKANYLIQNFDDKKRLLDGMVERELVIAEAFERGLDQDPELKAAIKALKEQLLFAKFIETEKAKVDVTGKDIEDFYNQYKEAFTIPEERRVSMIVVSSEDKAKELMITILQGGDFAGIAQANSIDTQSAPQGGDIGFIVRSKTILPQADKKVMFDKFEEVAFAAELNKPSAIFPGPNGYYILKVNEIKPSRQRLLSEVYNDIKEGLTIKQQEEGLAGLVENLRKSANIIIHEDLLRN